MISMSVSVSLSILVPLSHRGFVRRENVIPYIMGANITTFIDTLLAAVLLDNPQAFTVVLVEMVSITIVSAFILLLVYRPYERHAPVERVDHRQQPQPGDFHGDHFHHSDYACVDLRQLLTRHSRESGESMLLVLITGPRENNEQPLSPRE